MANIPVNRFATTRDDVGANLYTRWVFTRKDAYEVPDWGALERDCRIRRTFDPNDLTPGDYVFCRDDLTLRLTGTGDILWQCPDMNAAHIV